MKFWYLILTALIFFQISATAGTGHDLPDFGDSSGSVLSPEYDRRIGQAIMRQVRNHRNVVQDPEIEAYIKSLGSKLVTHSDDNTQNFIFFMIDDPSINAFAAPGGVVGINSGVMLNSDSESELASVVAHEISHVTQRHLARSFEAANRLSLPTAAAAIGAILLGVVNPQAGQAALAAVMGASSQYQINFTRANEEEADRIGMQLLVRAGFDPFGMPRFFERLQQISRLYRGNPPEFLLTHPLTTSRIADSLSRAEQYPPSDYKDSQSYKLVRARVTAESFDKPENAVRYFEQQLDAGGFPDMVSARYGYVTALMNANNFTGAEQQLTILLESDPENLTYLLAAARLETLQKKYQSAIQIYHETEKLYPGYRPLVMGYARTLLAAGYPDKARKLLRDYGQYHEQDHLYFDLLSQAEAQAGDPAESSIATAEYYYLVGSTEFAIKHLQFAQQKHKMSYHQEERVKARLAQLEYELDMERKLKLAE